MNDAATNQPPWTALRYTDRRVAGALIEKSKTTPASYPLTLNSIQTACNQKSNRFPQLELSVQQVFDAIERLMECDAIKETDGDSRSPKYRHRLYDWLGVDKVEIAVIGELLLRGAQTMGELRGRAARMEPIASLTQLRPVVDRLHTRNLIVYLTPPGRGCVVTHNLYQPEELEKLKSEHGNQAFETPVPSAASPPADSQTSDHGSDQNELARQVADLKQEVAEIRVLVEQLQAKISTDIDA